MIQPRVPEYSRPKKKTVKFVAGQKVRGPISVRLTKPAYAVACYTEVGQMRRNM